MDVGFHYYVTKVIAEKAGFTPEEAQIIAYACQYVDDANANAPIIIHELPHDECHPERLINKFCLNPSCTAHGGIEHILDAFDLTRKQILFPFHFLPEGARPGKKTYNYQTVPASTIATDLVSTAMGQVNTSGADSKLRQRALIKLGIALHSYEDTFAHQRFSARNSKVDNFATDIRDAATNKPIELFETKGQSFFGLTIGHGLIVRYADNFDTNITYVDGRGQLVHICNHDRFMQAAQSVFDLLKASNPASACVWDDVSSRFSGLFHDKLEPEYSKRNRKYWEKKFSTHFPEIQYDYDAHAWSKAALVYATSTEYKFGGEPGLKWIRFHKAAYEQCRYVVDNHLPAVC